LKRSTLHGKCADNLFRKSRCREAGEVVEQRGDAVKELRDWCRRWGAGGTNAPPKLLIL